MVGVAAVVALGAWTLVLPTGFESVRGLNLRALDAWRGFFGRWAEGPRPSGLETARAVFRGLTAVGWAGYGALVWCVFRGARLGHGWTWPLAVPLVLVLAFVMPPVLSTDVFAYLGYGRLAVVHGLNPHLHTQTELIRLGDPTAPYLRWPIASPYGPLWTLLSMAVVKLAPAGAVVGPVIAFKVVAAGALLGAAAAARVLVKRVDPERADATFALVALNPLLLLECPGSGHNDVVMVALVMAALAVHASGHRRAAAALVGAAAAVKLVPLVLVPWLALVAVRAVVGRWPARAAAAAVIVALALAPLAACYLPFWEGPRTLAGLRERWDAGGGTTAALRARRPTTGPAVGSTNAPAEPGRDTTGAVPSKSTPAPAPTPTPTWHAGDAAPSPRHTLGRIWPALLLFLWATAAVATGKGEPIFRLATVWGVVSLAIMLFVAGIWFPWYLAWTWPVAVLRFTRPHLALTGFLLLFSLMLMLAYALPPG